MRKRIISILLVLAVSLCGIWWLAACKENEPAPETGVENVIIMIPDGMSPAAVTLSRWYKAYDIGNGTVDTSVKLALDELASGSVRTYWESSELTGMITDSAPAASAMATGRKTNNKHISISNDGSNKPNATVLEAAKSKGKATGLVATVNIQHATPAAFSGHFYDRDNYEVLGKQQVYQNMDVVLGGGLQYLYNRGDKEDLRNTLADSGYQYVTTRSEMNGISRGKLWGMFASDSMAYDFDRSSSAAALAFAEEQPSLAEMTQKAIDILSKNENGFFLMVEGSKVDWGAHANDPLGVISETLAFDDAVKVALDFAKADNKTMLISASDHGNGGISLGNSGTNGNYSSSPVEKFIKPLKRAVLTGNGFEYVLNGSRSNITEMASLYLGITDLTSSERSAIAGASSGNMNYAVGPIISSRANIGWTTSGHTGEDVTLYSYLPDNGRITGTIENTDIARYAAQAFNVDMGALTAQIFQNAEDAFLNKGAEVRVDKSDSKNPVMVVTKGADKLELPESKNYAVFNGSKVFFESVTVQMHDKFFVPAKVINLI